MSAGVRTFLTMFSFAIAALAVVLWIRIFHVTGDDVSALFARLRWWTIPIIFVLLVAQIALSALRWTRIEIALGGTPPPFRRAFLAGAMALGLGAFMPGPLANVTCRALSNRLNGGSGVRGAIGGGLDQIADMAIVILLVIPATIAFVLRSPTIYVVGAPVIAALGWAASSALSVGKESSIANFASKRWPRIAPFFTSGLFTEIYALTLIRFATLTAITLMICAASNAGTFGAVLVSVPLVTLAISATMLPGAFGSSEWSFTGVLAGFGLPGSEITVFVLANRLVLTCLGIGLGLFAALFSLSHRPRTKRVVKSPL